MPPDSRAALFRASLAPMLEAHAYKGRRQPFVCSSCRHRLSTAPQLASSRPFFTHTRRLKLFRLPPATTRSTPPPRRRGARYLSGSAPLCESAQKGTSLQPSRLLGSLGRGPAGALGSFGSSFPRSTKNSGSLSGADLLPHERAARQQTPVSTPPPNPTPPFSTPYSPNSASKTQKPSVKAQRRKPKPNNADADAKATMSRAVLANVFNTDRQPRFPPTPASWTTGDDQAAPSVSTPESAPNVSAPTSAPRVSAPATAPSLDASSADATSTPTQPTPGRAAFGKRKVTVEEMKTSTSSSEPLPPPPGLGSLRNRMAQIAPPAPEPIVRDEVARDKTPLRPPTESGSGKASPAGPPTVNRDDFWDELETRFARHKAANGSKQDPTVPSPNADTQKPNNSQDTTTARQRQRHGSRQNTDEREIYRGRHGKASKKASKLDRAKVDDDDWDEEAEYRWEQRQRAKADKEARKQQIVEEEPSAVPIFLPEYISVSNLAQSLKKRTSQFLTDMEEMGFENITPDTIMTGDTAALVAMEYGFDPTVDTGLQRDLRPRPSAEDVSSLPERPPVVTIMGHVDHGKTTLLDWLRNSSVAAQEHGGITQHIGAFVVRMSSGKSITFLDTPGHAAFLSIRQRGANVTDIVVLVVAADDSVMPQTVEALKHATAAKVPIIVAINKIDKADARIEKVKTDLARHGVEIEDHGGDVQVVCVSGLTGRGMGDLEESIVTLSEILDVRAEPDGMAEGWILESSVKHDGKAATILVKRGTLRSGYFIVAGQSWARIRLLRNEAGTEVDEAPPGTPVEVLGWRDLPAAGEQVLQAPDEARAKMAVEYRRDMAEREENSLQLARQQQQQRDKAAAEAAEADGEAAQRAQGGPDKTSTESAPKAGQPGTMVQNFVVKADVAGSVEAVCCSILELGNHEVRAAILRSSAGQISEYDVEHAATSNSILVNFNMAVMPHIKQRAEAANVTIMEHSVIYHVADDVKAALSKLLPDSVSERVTGEADIVQIFPINVKKRQYKNIAGCRVRNGTIKRSSRVKVLREGEVIFDGHIETLKHIKKDVSEMGKGTECGIGLVDFQDIMEGDQIQTYEEIREKRSL